MSRELRSPEARGRIVAADGSVRRFRANHVGSAYVDDAGDWWMQWFVYDRRLPERTVVLQAELRAIRNAFTKHEHPVTVLSDSQTAVDLMTSWRAGRLVPIVGYCGRTLTNFSQRVAAHPEQFKVQWVPGHQGHALNEGADTLARLASRIIRDDVKLKDVPGRAAGIAEAFAAAYRKEAA